VKWKGYPNSEHSWDPVEALENAEDPVQTWWYENMLGEDYHTVFSAYINLRFTPTKDGYEQHSEEPTVDLVSGNYIWTPTMKARRFRFLCSMFEIMFGFCFRGVTGTGYLLVASII